LEVRGADPHTVKKKEKEKTHTALSEQVWTETLPNFHGSG